VAVLIHGGFWRARYTLRLEDRLVAELAGRGWAAWNVEYRRVGSPSAGGWPTTFEDVAAAIDHLERLEAPLDLSRVVAVGHSAGGHLALWAAGGESRVTLSGVVAQAGVLDLREAAALNLSDGAAQSLLGGSPDELPDRYDRASPVERLPIGVPTLVVHGGADDVVPPELSRRYAKRAGEKGDACEHVELPAAGHMDHLDPDSVAWRAVLDWLEKR
jgi:acetyl esterase/lipase